MIKKKPEMLNTQPPRGKCPVCNATNVLTKGFFKISVKLFCRCYFITAIKHKTDT